MKKPELEKIIKKLEKLDIREWTAHSPTANKESISVKTDGIELYLEKENFGIKSFYSLLIKNIEDDFWLINYSHSQENRASKKLIKDFYEKTNTQIEEYKMKILEEKIDNFLLE